MSVINAARSLAGQRPTRPVVSLYLDLDPERFATAPARSSQIRSLLDEVRRRIEHDDALEHEELMALREDVDRIDEYLNSTEPPFQGARALAVFCSVRDELFETVRLTRPVEGRVVIDRAPYIEPLLGAAHERNWCVALVNRRHARILSGPADQLQEHARLDEDTHGQHDQGGWSQANYERSYEKDADDHLRRVASELEQRWRRHRFDRLALGGPVEIVPRLEGMLSGELRARLARRVDVDVSTAGVEQVREAVASLAEEDERERRREALNRLAAGLGSSGRAVGGLEETLEALNQRRVETLLLEAGFDHPGGRCPSCGLLSADSAGSCPADGTKLEPVDLREATAESALAQDAEITLITDEPDLGPLRGIAALLRF